MLKFFIKLTSGAHKIARLHLHMRNSTCAAWMWYAFAVFVQLSSRSKIFGFGPCHCVLDKRKTIFRSLRRKCRISLNGFSCNELWTRIGQSYIIMTYEVLFFFLTTFPGQNLAYSWISRTRVWATMIWRTPKFDTLELRFRIISEPFRKIFQTVSSQSI